MPSDTTPPQRTASTDAWSIVVEVSAGIVRLPVARIDSLEVLIDSTIRLQIGERYELIVERPDGHAELIHAVVQQRNEAGLLLRWKPAHPRELTALERLFDESSAPIVKGTGLEDALRSRSRLVRTSAIAAQRDSVRVLNLSAIKELIQASVDEVIQESGRSIGEEEIKRLREESEKSFKEKLAEFQNENADLQSHIGSLRAKLERTQELLGTERDREVERDRFTLTRESLEELENTLERIIERATNTSELPEEVQVEIREVVHKSLEEERSRAKDREESARSENIDLLERKIQRLAKNLDAARSQRDQALESARRAESRDTPGSGSASVGAAVTPSPADEQSGRRKALLVDLMSENRQLRQQISKSVPSEQNRGHDPQVEKDLA
ncbi:MAG: hypothetical protein CBC13_10165 [Planctomycetia bacterium TMED53]|nr:MAG: hypothetical protein CBC13_10165 [Planctomycetia bacterium TMED53]